MRGPQTFRTQRSRALRRVDNDAEKALWSDLRDRRLNGYKFVRQHEIAAYFADFACRDKMLVVEVDGSQHAGSSYDRRRDDIMVSLGWSVLRFWNVDILRERDSVLETIVAALDANLDRDIVAPDLRFRASSNYGQKP